MRTTILLSLLSLLLATASVPTFAKPPKGEKTKTLSDEEAFKALDKDGDNLLSKEEFCANPAVPEEKETRKKRKVKTNTGEEFDKLDTDQNGKLTLEEFSKREEMPEEKDRKRKKGKAQE